MINTTTTTASSSEYCIEPILDKSEDGPIKEKTEKKEKKKGKSKKIVDLVPIHFSSHETPVSSSSYKKKTKGAKIIEAFAPETIPTNVKPINVILQLKCSILEIDGYIQKSNWKYQNLTYNPSIPTDIEAYEDNILKKSFGDYSQEISVPNTGSGSMNLLTSPASIPESDKKGKNGSCTCSCSYRSKEENTSSSSSSVTSLQEDELQKIRQLKIAFYRNEMQEKKSDCFWCSYPYDNDPCYILNYGYNNEIYGHGSFCSPECGVAFLFGKQSTWDDSAKTEAYQLMNYYYGKPNGFQQSIKPALSPYYFLEKFYGNLTIQEYRRLTKSNHMMLVVDKPVTRILPEIHEDNDHLLTGMNSGGGTGGHTGSTNSGGKYKVKKQSEKAPGQTRNNILREQFGLGRIDARD